MQVIFLAGLAFARAFTTQLPDDAPSMGDAGAPPLATAELDIADLDLSSLLDTPIASVSRYQEKRSRAPASVFVLTREDIRRQGFRTVEEVLASMPGVFVSNDSLYPTIGIRGMNPLGDLTTRILVLVDGHPLNNGVGIGQSYTERDLPVTVEALERVEIIKGPIGTVYGPTAHFGVINLVTLPLDASGGVAAASGEFSQAAVRTGTLAASYVGEVKGIRFGLHGGGIRSRGREYAFPELETVDLDREVPPGGVVAGDDRLDGQNLYARLEKGGFGVTAGWWERSKGLPTAPYGVNIGDPRNLFYNRTLFAQLTWGAQLVDGARLDARVSVDDFRYQDALHYADEDTLGVFRDVAADRWYSAELRATFTPHPSHRDTVGAELQTHATRQHSFYDNLPSALEDPVNGFGVGPIDVGYRVLSAYLLVEQELGQHVVLQGGLNAYSHELFGGRLTPKASIVIDPTEEDTFKLIYAEGFRPPSAYEAFFEDGLDFIGNPQLRSEGARSLELSYEHRATGFATLTASVFQNDYQDLIVFAAVPAPDLGRAADPAEPTDFRQQAANQGSIRMRGADIGVNLRAPGVVDAYGGIGVQEAEYSGSSSRANFPQVVGALSLSTRAFHESLALSLNGHYVGERLKDPAGLYEGDPPAAPGYLLIGASARLDIRWVKGLTAQLTVYNLLNAAVVDPLVGDHAPLTQINRGARDVRLSAEYSF